MVQLALQTARENWTDEEFKAMCTVIGYWTFGNSVWDLCSMILEHLEEHEMKGADLLVGEIATDLLNSRDPNEPDASDPDATLEMFRALGEAHFKQSQSPIDG